ncbi:hypothetical protein EVAR_89253_1 [Eumeta japonica]|uniref:Uncharacterized protein n=1 Tax=Eumeta variegata TaxID=151549 RepID=A0A4C1VKG8_EUMVA|nr:hypothetical protein EVAR_89253_1 [Eumeta japonica]
MFLAVILIITEARLNVLEAQTRKTRLQHCSRPLRLARVDYEKALDRSRHQGGAAVSSTTPHRLYLYRNAGML